MYRLLIVDDEPDVADGLYRFFTNSDGIAVDLDVSKAYSAFEALDVLASCKVDILLTDIMMPGMTGLQLVETVRRQWPLCRVIFLTGYNEFDYIYSAMKYDSVSYLLKTESFDAIAGAVAKAAAQIEESLKRTELEEQANARLAVLMPILRREYLADLVAGGPAESSDRAGQFCELGIPLDADKPVLLLLGHIAPGEGGATAVGMARADAHVTGLAERLFPDSVRLAHTGLDKGLPLWLAQPADGRDAAWQRLAAIVRDCAEAVQDAAAGALGLRLSFAVDTGAFPWEALPERYTRLKRLLADRCGRAEDLVLIAGEPGGEAWDASQETAGAHDALILRLKEFINSHLNEDLSLARLAAMTYFNPAYLSRLFKQTAGINLLGYINDARVSRARQLLAGTGMKVHEIAARVGYDSSSYFTQFFKRLTGITPQEYRERNSFR